jgi:hypothetical protein
MLHPSFINFGTKTAAAFAVAGIPNRDAEQRPRMGTNQKSPFLGGEKLCEKENP